MIDTIPIVLAWQSGGANATAVFRSYVHLLSDAFSAFLRRLSRSESGLADRLAVLVREVSDDAFLRVLTAPETSFRLLWNGGVSDAARAEFFLSAFRAEVAREHGSHRFEIETWTALGDIGFGPDGDVLGNWRLEGMMPLDFGSPLARATATAEMELDGERLDFQPFSDEEIARVLTRLAAAGRAIRDTSQEVMDFATTFNRVLVCVKDAVAPFSFASGSTGQYVGRSFLANPHLTNVDEVAIAEGIVHEAVHGLLFMLERRNRWVADALYMGPARIVSPWSGNPLRLRPYLQACFVWFGLLHFWGLALGAGAFSAARVRSRISTCVQGFLGGSLVDAVNSFIDGISPDLIETIAVMQAHVVESVSDTVPELLLHSSR